MVRHSLSRYNVAGLTNSDLEVNELLGGVAHLVAEAKLVVADGVGREDKVSLSFLLTVQDDLVAGA